MNLEFENFGSLVIFICILLTSCILKKKKTAYVSELQNRSSYEKVENLNWKSVSVCCHSGILYLEFIF